MDGWMQYVPKVLPLRERYMYCMYVPLRDVTCRDLGLVWVFQEREEEMLSFRLFRLLICLNMRCGWVSQLASGWLWPINTYVVCGRNGTGYETGLRMPVQLSAMAMYHWTRRWGILQIFILLHEINAWFTQFKGQGFWVFGAELRLAPSGYPHSVWTISESDMIQVPATKAADFGWEAYGTSM